LVLLLGGAYCAVYRRQRELFLMVTVYIAYFLLDTQTDFYRDNGRVRRRRGDLPPGLPAAAGVVRPVRRLAGTYPPAQDMVARGAVLFAVGSVAWPGAKLPQALLTWLAEIRWPALHGQWMSLIQMVLPAVHRRSSCWWCSTWRNPRPLHAAQLIGLLGIFWMLPQTFILPFTLNIMCSQVMLMIAAAVAHEAYQMAFRDELTGLPGRRALNERMQRLGRNYVIAMSDVDHFKKFNDTHGHDVGDQVLRLVASRCPRSPAVAAPTVMAVRSSPWCSPARPPRNACRTWRRCASDRQLRHAAARPEQPPAGRYRRAPAPGGSAAARCRSPSASAWPSARPTIATPVLKSADQALYSAKRGAQLHGAWAAIAARAVRTA
jgi:GGDEF domain-containing protein